MPKVLTERMAFSGGTVGGTADAPVIEGVLLCGPVSANRRRYLKKAFEGDRVKRYDGVPVNLNHGRGADGRPYQEQIGIVRNPRHRADGMPVGDIAVNPKKPYAEAFLWDAKNQPKACGMSHVAHCETARAADGWEDVTELVRVESVDVISAGNAATTVGLYESKGSRRVFTIKQIAAWVARHSESTSGQVLKAKRLAEEEGMGDVPALDAEPAADADPDGAITAGFKAAIDAVVDKVLSGELDRKEARKKIDKLFTSHGDATEGGSAPAADDDGEGDDEPAEESKKKRKAADPIGVLSECKALGYEPGVAELKTLTLMTAADRVAHVREQMAKAADAKAEKPKSPGRNPGPGAKRTQESAPAKPAADVKEFLGRVTR